MFLPTLVLLRSVIWKLQPLEKHCWNGSQIAEQKKCDFFRKIAQINRIFWAYTQQCIIHLCAKFQRFTRRQSKVMHALSVEKGPCSLANSGTLSIFSKTEKGGPFSRDF